MFTRIDRLQVDMPIPKDQVGLLMAGADPDEVFAGGKADA